MTPDSPADGIGVHRTDIDDVLARIDLGGAGYTHGYRLTGPRVTRPRRRGLPLAGRAGVKFTSSGTVVVATTL